MNIKDWKRVVAGDDGREGGDCALAAAHFLQERLGLAPLVVHSIHLPVVTIPGSAHPDALVTARAEIAERAEAWLKERVHASLGEAAEYRVELDSPSRALIRAARSLPAEVIAVGPHAKGGLFDFGGTQRHVFSGAEAHVWSQPTPDVKVERIIAPFDFDDKSEAVVGAALALAVHLRVPLVVMHCSESIGFVDPIPAYAGDAGMPVYVIDAMHKATEARFKGWFEGYDFGDADVESRFAMGSPVVAIAEEQGANDLVVMGTRGHTGVAAAVLGGVTYGILKARHGPVLALRS